MYVLGDVPPPPPPTYDTPVLLVPYITPLPPPPVPYVAPVIPIILAPPPMPQSPSVTFNLPIPAYESPPDPVGQPNQILPTDTGGWLVTNDGDPGAAVPVPTSYAGTNTPAPSGFPWGKAVLAVGLVYLATR